MDNKILILYDSIDFFIPYMERNKDVKVERLYRKRNPIISIFKKIFLKLELFNKSWYNSWINNISDYSTIIVFATQDYTFIQWIKANYPSVKIIMWYWNPAFRMGIPRKDLYSLADIWSFDRDDCEKYDMRFNSTFYFSNILLPKKKILYDILFLGIDKGRRVDLRLQEEVFNKKGVSTYFHIVPDKGEYDKYKERSISYKDYLELVASSKAILDIKPLNQEGLTLRPMEALFFKKKLVTTDSTIVNESFYNSRNIFVLGIDSIELLTEFLNTPYLDVENEVLEYYDFCNWLKRLK